MALEEYINACPACDGTGEMSNGRFCDYCGGAGVIRGTNKMVEGDVKLGKPKYEWVCPDCGAHNHDTRKSFVLCVGCGATFDSLDKLTPPRAED